MGSLLQPHALVSLCSNIPLWPPRSICWASFFLVIIILRRVTTKVSLVENHFMLGSGKASEGSRSSWVLKDQSVTGGREEVFHWKGRAQKDLASVRAGWCWKEVTLDMAEGRRDNAITSLWLLDADSVIGTGYWDTVPAQGDSAPALEQSGWEKPTKKPNTVPTIQWQKPVGIRAGMST